MSFFFQGMPGMEDFADMQGGGGGGEEEEEEEDQGQKSSSNERYYEILGLQKGATEEEIKQAFRKLARQMHPDRHPDEKEKYHQKFTELQEAYEVLSDPEKKQLYDRYGEAGLKGGGASGMSDIFDMFFGGSGRGGRASQRQQKAPSINVFLDIKLEDCYIGTTKKVKYEQMLLCRDCNGKGGKKSNECSTCNGTGTQVIMQRMGYITMQTQRECTKCDGQGTIIHEDDKCKKCDGQGMSKVSKEIDWQIPRGSKNADKIILRGQGHEVPDAANGDVVIVLRVEKHPLFQRAGADLAMTQHISLKALCGYDIKIPHVSGKILRLKSKKGETVQPLQLKVVYEQGMPQKGSANVFGHLYVKFEINFPKTGDLTQQMLEKIAQLLPETNKDEKEENKENKENNNNNNNNNNNKNHNNNKNNNDNDDDNETNNNDKNKQKAKKNKKKKKKNKKNKNKKS